VSGKILIVGDSMLDRYWSGRVDRISPEAPVPVVSIDGVTERAGGAANVAANVSALSGQGQLLSIVGDDDSGRKLDEILAGMGVNRFMHIDPEARTIEKLRVVSKNQQLIRLDFEKGFSADILNQILSLYEKEIGGASIVVMSDYGKGVLESTERFIAIANEADVPVVVDPKGTDFNRYKGASMITPNLDEFTSIVGPCGSPAVLETKAREMIRELRLGVLLITQGSDGMTLYLESGETYHQSSVAREVYDVSGAGDTVVAALSVSMAAGLPWPIILERANTAAGIVVGKFGTAVVTLAELDSVLDGGRY